MKKNFTIRLTESRLIKLRKLSKEREKSMTAMIEDWIDRLPSPKEDGG
jgi:hypothetical protein